MGVAAEYYVNVVKVSVVCTGGKGINGRLSLCKSCHKYSNGN